MRRGPKRTAAQREEASLEVARLDAQGYPSRAIAEKLGVHFNQVLYDLKIIKRRYAEATLEERHAKVMVKVAQLRETRREAWEAWERSKENAVKTVKEKIVPAKDTDENDSSDGDGKCSGGRMKVVITTEGRLPANEYQTTILRALEQETDLLGLKAPVKVAPMNPEGDEEYALTDAERLAGLQNLYAAVGQQTGMLADGQADADGPIAEDSGPGTDEAVACVEEGPLPLFPDGVPM